MKEEEWSLKDKKLVLEMTHDGYDIVGETFDDRVDREPLFDVVLIGDIETLRKKLIDDISYLLGMFIDTDRNECEEEVKVVVNKRFGVE